MGIELNYNYIIYNLKINYIIYLITGLTNLREEIKYVLKVTPVQGQLKL